MHIRNKLFQSSWDVMSKERRRRKEKTGKRDPSDILWWLHLGNFPLICPNIKLKKGNCIIFPQAHSPFLSIHSFFFIYLLGIKVPALPSPPPMVVMRIDERDGRVADVKC